MIYQEKMHIDYVGRAAGHAAEINTLMRRAEFHLKGYISPEQTITWLQLKQHFEEGVRGLEAFLTELEGKK